jgi:hypothetical protein
VGGPSDVTVIVPVRNGAGAIGAVLDGLAAQQDVAFDVVVVDNGSDDGTAEVARRHPVGPCVVIEPRPGSYAARNAGLQAATAPVLAFTDVDCTPEPTWLAAGLAKLDAAQVDLVGGAVKMWRSSNPTIWEHYDRGVYLRQEDVVLHGGWAVTANLFVRRAVFDAVGPFDASLMSGGDRELCRRAGRAGFRIAYAPDALVRHQPRRTGGEIWQVNKRVGRGLAALHARGDVPAWWRGPQQWTSLDWVIELIRRDGPALRRRQVLPVHAVAMSARLYGRMLGWAEGHLGRTR